ncbi:MAG: sugar phosphate isomerase/epimerase [Bryobacterales bacterium]|nr:sugar phosphate isomerase/epimerase [Bryobacterales bacterium]
MPSSISRRAMLGTMTAAGASAGTAAANWSAANKFLLGGPIFVKSDDPRELAREHKRLGYGAAYCPAAKAGDTARLQAIEAAYAAEGIVIAEVGVWVNLLDADAAKRKENLQKVIDGLTVADAVGARCCVDIAGSFHPTVWYGPHPRNVTKEFFDAAVANARTIIDAVKPKRAKFAYEMMGWNLPDSAESYIQMIKAIDRPAFGVHIDICNLINSPARYYNSAALTEETLRKLARWIVSCHAKDVDWIPEMNVHIVEVIPGRGTLDFRPYLKGLAALPAPVPLMIEHLKNAGEYAEGAAHIRKVASSMGL